MRAASFVDMFVAIEVDGQLMRDPEQIFDQNFLSQIAKFGGKRGGFGFMGSIIKGKGQDIVIKLGAYFSSLDISLNNISSLNSIQA